MLSGSCWRSWRDALVWRRIPGLGGGRMFDDRNYSVTANRGFRRSSLTLKEATLLVARLREFERTQGVEWSARVYYRDGKEVDIES